MLILIDGHNLIPHIPGLSLAESGDEDALIPLLQEFCRLRRRTVEVYFDRAPVGRAGQRQFGQVRAVFVRTGTTADDAIMARLWGLGKRSRNVQVVSSDHQVQQAARAVHAEVVSSPAFAGVLEALSDENAALDPRNRLLSAEEMEEWESLFRRGHPPERK